MATTEVNGKICLNPAYDVSEKDIVKYDGRRIIPADIKPIPEINFLLVVFLIFIFLIIFTHLFNDVHSYQ